MSLVDVSDIVYVKRSNVVLKVAREDADRYIAKGYDLIDAEGKVLKASVPTDVGALQKALSDKDKEIQKLKTEIASLKSELSAPKQSTTTKKTSTKKNA